MGFQPHEANARAWAYGRSQLEAAIENKASYALETTLGARTIPALLAKAASTHDVVMLFCGSQSPELHIRRVRLRVAHGGHDIPEDKIRERWVASRVNLIRLMPLLARPQVFDNSAEAEPGQDIPIPVLVLETVQGQLTFPDPDDPKALDVIPEWARPIVQAAIDHRAGPTA